MGGSGGDDEDDALTVTAERAADASILHVRGELDVATAGRLEDAVAAVADGAADLVLDMSGLTFVDSSGLTALVRVHKAVAARSGSVTVRGARPFVTEVLKMVSLDRFFTIEP